MQDLSSSPIAFDLRPPMVVANAAPGRAAKVAAAAVLDPAGDATSDRAAEPALPLWALALSASMVAILRVGLFGALAARALEWVFARLGFCDYLVSAGMRPTFVRSLLRTVRAKLSRGDLAFGPVARWVAVLLTSALTMHRRSVAFAKREGFKPPAFLVVTATDRCNFECAHCYARSSSGNRRNLDYATFSQLIDEQRAQWGASMVIVTGGEPFLYRTAQGDLLSLARAHPRTLFIVYTNGTQITDRVATQLAELGNVAPLISLEGNEAQTAAVRGPTAWPRAMEAMRRLKEHGVIFGVSLTAGRANADLLQRPSYYEWLRDEQGATFFWILERAPMGRAETAESDLLSLDQKRRLQHSLQQMLSIHGLLAVSFLHVCGAHSGCMGAGRVDGFFHVESNGDVKHCVYSPFRLDNVNAIFAAGEPLSRFLRSPQAAAIREAQRAFFARNVEGRRHRPCPVFEATSAT